MILPHMNNAFSQKYVSLFDQRIELHITKNHLLESQIVLNLRSTYR